MQRKVETETTQHLQLLAVAMLLITKLASFCTSQTSLESRSITPPRMPGLSHTAAIWGAVPATTLLNVQQVSFSPKRGGTVEWKTAIGDEMIFVG